VEPAGRIRVLRSNHLAREIFRREQERGSDVD
jgi:hypothetical protein